MEPVAAFVVSCCGRGEDMHGVRELEAKAHSTLLPRVPTMGFFANGEVGPAFGKSQALSGLGCGHYQESPDLYGYTTCMGLLVTDITRTASSSAAAEEEE